MSSETIFALSSAWGQAGVAVIRISGDKSFEVMQRITHKKECKERYLEYCTLYDKDDKIIDKAMCVFFKGPKSFTGEDVLEIHCHGSRAVIEKIFSVLSQIADCRLAERGEYTRRAVYHNKMDLTSAEGLIDLIHADTEAQRKWAVRQMGGELQKLYDSWREILVKNRAYLEAFIDFPEEEIPLEKMLLIEKEVKDLVQKIENHLNDNNRGQVLHEGYKIAIIGAPNVGKSSLLNRLAQKEVAIVADTAGTTRDIVEVYLNVEGYPVFIADTAGLRETNESIEKEGVRRAKIKAKEADLLLVMGEVGSPLDEETRQIANQHDCKIFIWNKIDKDFMNSNKKFINDETQGLFMSAKTGEGIELLWQAIRKKVVEKMTCDESPLLTRARYKTALQECLEALKRFLIVSEIELKAEELRIASTSLGKITGIVATEELLDIIFSSFCIGK